MFRLLFLAGTHAMALVLGIALGIYLLPILTAPEAPGEAALVTAAEGALFKATLTRDLKGNDFLHWGEGEISVSPERIVHRGRLSPGPDYRLYLVPDFVEDEAQFLPLKSASALVAEVKSFDGFIVEVPAGIDVSAYTTVLVWCEAFGEFITAARYR